MAIEIVTGFQGKPHVKANDIAGFQQGVTGTKDYVMGVGKKAKATLVSNNSVRIDDGELVMQGVHFRILPGTYENVTINNGSQNMKRKDLIVARYTKNSGNGIENITLAVLQGTPTSGTAVAPVPTIGDIRSGALKHEMPLYVVELNGLNVVSVDPAFDILMSMKEFQDGLDELNSKLKDSGWVECKMGNGISPYAGHKPPSVRKIGNIVFLNACVTNKTSWIKHDNIITIPEDFRPKYEINTVQQGSTSNRFNFIVYPDGTCQADRYTNNDSISNKVPLDSWLNLYASWTID